MTRLAVLARSFSSFLRGSARRGGESQRRKPFRRPLRLEALEDRCVPATITVTNSNDAGAGSLRQAILMANLDAATDEIRFAAGLTSPITLTTGELTITQSLVITGPGSGALTINGNNASRIFNVDDTLAGAITVTLSGLTLTNANSGAAQGGAIRDANETLTLTGVVLTANTAASDGGAIAVTGAGALAIQNSTLSSNSTTGAFSDGGAVYLGANGTLLLQNSTVSGNTAGQDGAGLYLYSGGNLTVQNSTISGNSSANAAAQGGGIYFWGTGNLLIQNSTISGNTVTGTTGLGGGLFLTTFTGSAVIENSTLSGNRAGMDGGGLRLSSGAGALTIRNSTIADNTADADSNGTGSGGGLSLASGTVQLVSTLVADNVDNSGTAPDIGGTVQAATFNLIESVTGTVLTFSANNITGLDPMLGTLADNGGPTQTYALQLASPAINTGFNPVGLTTDQRGTTFPRVSGSAPDIGATEFSVAPPTLNTIMVTNNNDAGAGSLRQAILMANLDAATDEIQFAAGLTSPITLTTGELTITQSLVITGPGSGALTINGNNASRIFNVDDTLAGAITVTLSGLTLTNANSGAAQGGAIRDANETLTLTGVVLTANTAASDGGAIAVSGAGALTIQNSTLSGNSTTGAASDGGAVYLGANGTLLLQNSTVSGNTAGDDGAGLYLYSGGNLTVQNSTISGNTSANAGARGGGIYFYGTGNLLIQNSTISGNTVTGTMGRGGGLFLTAFTGSAVIENSTLSGNQAGTDGGGLRLHSGTGALTIRNSTIADNTADVDSNGTGSGGGLSLASGTVQLVSTLVADNVDNSGTAPDIGGTVQAATFNLIESVTGTVLTFSANNITGLDPMLGTLADNGGPTQTYALQLASPAINTGFNPVGLTSDQRGTTFPRVSGSAPDIGAFEFQFDTTPPTASIGAITSPRTTPVGTVTISFSENVTGFNLADLTLTRDGSGVALTGLTLTTVNPGQYTIDLSSVTVGLGNYVLTLTAAGSGILDAASNPLAANASATWQTTATDTTAPTASIGAVTTPRTTPVGTVTINFSENVTGFDLADLALTRDGSSVSLGGLTLTMVNASQYTMDLSSVTVPPGNYVFTLTAAGSGIVDAASNPLAANASTTWQTTATTGDNPVVTLGGDAQVPRGTVFSRSGSFTDAGPSPWTATVNYGDNTGSLPLTLNADQTFVLNHTYTLGGIYTLTVTVTDAGSAMGSSTAAITVTTSETPPTNLTEAGRMFTHSTEYFRYFLTQAYLNYVNRTPDESYLQMIIPQMQSGLVSDEYIEALFIGAPEYIQKKGGTDEQWVRSMYTDLLFRMPRADELSYWSARLAQIRVEHAADPTFNENVQAAFEFDSSDEREGHRVQANYTTYLGRQGNTQEVNYWVQQFKLFGQTSEDLAAGFVGSFEYFNRPVKGRGNRTEWIRSAYADVLHRPPSQAEIDYWLAFLNP